MTKKASALPCLSFIFLISQRENSPSCPGHLGEEEALTQLSRCLLSPESCTERHKSRKGRACRPPSALMPFYIFRRTFHISTRSCKNLSWAVPLINFTLWHTSELSGHTEVLLASVPTHLTVSPETIPWRPPYRFGWLMEKLTTLKATSVTNLGLTRVQNAKQSKWKGGTLFASERGEIKMAVKHHHQLGCEGFICIISFYPQHFPITVGPGKQHVQDLRADKQSLATDDQSWGLTTELYGRKMMNWLTSLWRGFGETGLLMKSSWGCKYQQLGNEYVRCYQDGQPPCCPQPHFGKLYPKKIVSEVLKGICKSHQFL